MMLIYTKRYNCFLARSFGSTLMILLLLSLLTSLKAENQLVFSKLTVDYSQSPIDITDSHPRFSWIISSTARNQAQQAFQILVSSTASNLAHDKGDLWDSGKIISDQTIQHAYQGLALKSFATYFWKVVIWDHSNKRYACKTAKFETAFLSDELWKASWIGNVPAYNSLPAEGFFKDVKQQDPKDSVSHDGKSLLLRREVKLEKVVKSAKAFITGLGFYEFYINGQRVGDHVLAPAKTPYNHYVLYDTYDVSAFVHAGLNAFGIHLGNGWYNPYKKWWNDYRMQWFGAKKAIAQIRIEFQDGSIQWVNTDNKWNWALGPVTYNCVYDGEIYDASLAHKGWSKPGYDASSWQKAISVDLPATRLVSHRMPAIKIHEIFKPKELVTPQKGVRIFDMGQNFAGWIHIIGQGSKNTIIKFRFAEDLNADGTLDITSNEHANASAEFRMSGDAIESYRPSFTYFGFKYVEVKVLNGPFKLLTLNGEAVYSDNSQTGQFNCSNQLVNKIHKATVWSQKSNMMGYPMDCPQRDERLGWFGDAQVTAEEAMSNFDMALFYQNWFEGIRVNQDLKSGDIPIISPRPYILDQGIEWSSTYLIMAWQTYQQYGDRKILEDHYAAFKSYMLFLDRLAKDYILPKGWIGDWGSMVKGWKEGEPASVPTAYYFLNAQIMADIAQVLNNSDDQIYFKALSEKIKLAYNSNYLSKSTANYSDGSQMANAFPLFLGLVPSELKQRVLDNLVHDIVVKNNTHLTTGVLGTKYLPEALAQAGMGEVAWKLINQKTAPSWNDMMNKYTTMCEFWTLKQSKNHVMMGSIDAWFYKYIAGIQVEKKDPAFTSFLIKPLLLDSLNSAEATIETIKGSIGSSWKIENSRFALHVSVPFNTHATVYIPGDKKDLFLEGGLPLEQNADLKCIGYQEGAYVVRVPSGNYLFTREKR